MVRNMAMSKEERKKYYKKYNQDHQEEIKKYRQDHQEERNLNGHKYRQKVRSLVYDYTKTDWEETLEAFDNRCAYCGKKSKNLAKEHIVPVTKSGHFIKGNIIPACKSCNSSKGNRRMRFWYQKQEFFTIERYKKIVEWQEDEKQVMGQKHVQAGLFLKVV